MNREIKFRAWDAFNSEMIYPNKQGMFIGTGGYNYAMVLNGVGDVIPMQFTGLTDKNGKEIWEGDVCRVAHSGLCEIFWDEMRARFGVRWIDKTFKSIRGEVEMIFNNHEIVFEVIGNIYENPELLKQPA